VGPFGRCGVGNCLRNWACGAFGRWISVWNWGLLGLLWSMGNGEILWLNGRLFWRLSLCGLLVGLNLVFKSLNLVVVVHRMIVF
jgi:hypothetical protein